MIQGFVENGYTVEILSDSFLEEMSELDGVALRSLTLTKARTSLNSLLAFLPARLNSLIERALFAFDISLSVKIALYKERYDLSYLRASLSASTVTNILKKKGVPVIVEVNKPISMTAYNNDDALKWPSPHGHVPKVEKEVKLLTTLHL